MSDKLSEAQVAVVQLMLASSFGVWWTQEELGGARRSTLDALVRKGFLVEHMDEYADLRYKLNAEAERVPVPDEDIPF